MWILTRACAVGLDAGRLRLARLGGLEVAEQPFDLGLEVAVDLARDPDDHALRLVPAVDVAEERVPARPAHGLLAADDVPAQRLVAVEERVVDPADVVARSVEVHVHLLDDHALLALDLLGVEARVAEHVDEHVEGDRPVLARAAHVVARVLLAGERVELAADAVDLVSDVARGGAVLGSLEEHVLGEVRDPARVRGLVARARGEHHEAGDGLRVLDRRGEQAESVGQGLSLEDGHQAARASFQVSGSATGRPFS